MELQYWGSDCNQWELGVKILKGQPSCSLEVNSLQIQVGVFSSWVNDEEIVEVVDDYDRDKFSLEMEILVN